jgi:hypothetical protein
MRIPQTIKLLSSDRSLSWSKHNALILSRDLDYLEYTHMHTLPNTLVLPDFLTFGIRTLFVHVLRYVGYTCSVTLASERGRV